MNQIEWARKTNIVIGWIDESTARMLRILRDRNKGTVPVELTPEAMIMKSTILAMREEFDRLLPGEEHANDPITEQQQKLLLMAMQAAEKLHDGTQNLETMIKESAPNSGRKSFLGFIFWFVLGALITYLLLKL